MSFSKIFAVFFLVMPVPLAVYNIKTNKDSTKKRIKRIVLIFVILFLLLIAAGVAEGFVLDGYEDDYQIIGKEYDNCAFYKTDEQGRHIFITGLDSKGEQVEDIYYAVDDSVDMPFGMSLTPKCSLLVPKDKLSENTQWEKIGEYECVVLPEGTLIRTCFTEIMLYALVWLYLAFAGYQTVRSFITVINSGKAKAE